MFLYWEGFEIDGSDTNFDVVLPENVQAYEFVDCFLSIPIFDKTVEPRIFRWQDQKERKLKKAAFKEKLIAGKYSGIRVKMHCLHPEQLPENLRNSIYVISGRRDPHEDAFDVAEDPCAAPILPEKYARAEKYARGGKTVVLGIGKVASPRKTVNKPELRGYVHNAELLRSTKSGSPCFVINVGPGFYFEYAIFIIDYLRDHFPGMGVCGGLDCGGGWTYGCTYADSLYEYDKIHLPVKDSIKSTMKRLTEYGIVKCPPCQDTNFLF